MRIVVLGPPGSGKGTRAKIIGEVYKLPVIATGDMLREAVANGTEMGKLADIYMKRGELVKDDTVIGIVKERLKRPDVKDGFVLDGFPRNLPQAQALDTILKEIGVEIDAVLNVIASADTIMGRLSLRSICPTCGAIYHIKDKPPKKLGICDVCGETLIQREDDKNEIINHRLKVYEEQTYPILERYDKMGKTREISGELGFDEIKDEIKRVLNDLT
jgi:adenylate kinase